MLVKINTRDGQEICAEDSRGEKAALLFAHGWLGNRRWWDDQKSEFSRTHRVVTIDLVGHGASTKTRRIWSMENHAQDILDIIKALNLSNVTIVAHSMSGSSGVLAASQSSDIDKIVLVDTLQHVGKMPTAAEVEPMLNGLANNYANTISAMVSPYMFNERTPQNIRQRLMDEFLAADSDLAVKILQPFYQTNIESAARDIRIPVRAIQSDKWPTDIEMNRGYFADYECSFIKGVGHYPMLETPIEFNEALRAFL